MSPPRRSSELLDTMLLVARPSRESNASVPEGTLVLAVYDWRSRHKCAAPVFVDPSLPAIGA